MLVCTCDICGSKISDPLNSSILSNEPLTFDIQSKDGEREYMCFVSVRIEPKSYFERIKSFYDSYMKQYKEIMETPKSIFGTEKMNPKDDLPQVQGVLTDIDPVSPVICNKCKKALMYDAGEIGKVLKDSKIYLDSLDSLKKYNLMNPSDKKVPLIFTNEDMESVDEMDEEDFGEEQ